MKRTLVFLTVLLAMMATYLPGAHAENTFSLFARCGAAMHPGLSGDVDFLADGVFNTEDASLSVNPVRDSGYTRLDLSIKPNFSCPLSPAFGTAGDSNMDSFATLSASAPQSKYYTLNVRNYFGLGHSSQASYAESVLSVPVGIFDRFSLGIEALNDYYWNGSGVAGFAGPVVNYEVKEIEHCAIFANYQIRYATGAAATNKVVFGAQVVY